MRPFHLLLVALVCGGVPACAAGLQIRTTELPWAAVDSGYDVTLTIAGSGRCLQGDVALSLAAGRLPRGLEVTSDGLHGIPREIGQYRFAIRAANTCSETVREYVLLVTGKPILRAVPEELTFQCREGAVPEPQTLQISASWPDLPYSATTATPQWLNLRPMRGLTPERGAGFTADTLWVQANPEKLMPGVYRSTITVTAWGGSNVAAIPVVLMVLPAILPVSTPAR